MALRHGLAAATAMAGLALAGSASAQTSKVVPAPNKEQIDSASFNLKVMMSALQSDKVEGPVKSALFACIYENSLSKISQAIENVITANPGKVDKTNPSQVLGVMAGVCGYKAPGATPTPTPKK